LTNLQQDLQAHLTRFNQQNPQRAYGPYVATMYEPPIMQYMPDPERHDDRQHADLPGVYSGYKSATILDANKSMHNEHRSYKDPSILSSEDSVQ
jgi:hypothetical protein